MYLKILDLYCEFVKNCCSYFNLICWGLIVHVSFSWLDRFSADTLRSFTWSWILQSMLMVMSPLFLAPLIARSPLQVNGQQISSAAAHHPVCIGCICSGLIPFRLMASVWTIDTSLISFLWVLWLLFINPGGSSERSPEKSSQRHILRRKCRISTGWTSIFAFSLSHRHRLKTHADIRHLSSGFLLFLPEFFFI